MPRNPKSAVVAVRMTPQLRDGLKEAAAAAGSSLNAYVVQVLAAAAGHRVRFRGTAETGPLPEEQRDELRELERDDRGFPTGWKERWQHGGARQKWVEQQRAGMDFGALMALVRRIDAECPWHYVRWDDLEGPVWPEELRLQESA